MPPRLIGCSGLMVRVFLSPGDQPGRRGRPAARHLRGQVVEDRALAVALLASSARNSSSQAERAVPEARVGAEPARASRPRSAARRSGTRTGRGREGRAGRGSTTSGASACTSPCGAGHADLEALGQASTSRRPATVVSARDTSRLPVARRRRRARTSTFLIGSPLELHAPVAAGSERGRRRGCAR